MIKLQMIQTMGELNAAWARKSGVDGWFSRVLIGMAVVV